MKFVILLAFCFASAGALRLSLEAKDDTFMRILKLLLKELKRGESGENGVEDSEGGAADTAADEAAVRAMVEEFTATICDTWALDEYTTKDGTFYSAGWWGIGHAAMKEGAELSISSGYKCKPVTDDITELSVWGDNALVTVWRAVDEWVDEEIAGKNQQVLPWNGTETTYWNVVIKAVKIKGGPEAEWKFSDILFFLLGTKEELEEKEQHLLGPKE